MSVSRISRFVEVECLCGHELVHSSGAREELVAELGSAFLAADLGIELEPREDHAAYIESWLQVLRDDKRAIFSAAAHAQRAADYLHSLQADESKGGLSRPLVSILGWHKF